MEMNKPNNEEIQDLISDFFNRSQKAAINRAIDVLNEALATDPVAIHAMFVQRVHCSSPLGDHPTIQVVEHITERAPGVYTDTYSLGVLGLINGLFGVDADNRGFICAHWDGGQITKFGWTEPGLSYC